MTKEEKIQQAADEQIDRRFSCSDQMRSAFAIGAKSQAAKEYWQQEWIDVNERLPEKENLYIVYNSYFRRTEVLTFSIHHNCWDDLDGDDFYTEAVGGKVTHWMPLPDKPSPQKS